MQTKGIHKEMCFLITDLGGEDIILRYPWLTTFEPHIVWGTATIDVAALPIVIWTVNMGIPQNNPIIARALSQPETETIVQQLLETTTIQTTTTDLALAAQHKAPKVKIPTEYQQHAWVFSKE